MGCRNQQTSWVGRKTYYRKIAKRIFEKGVMEWVGVEAVAE